MPLCDLVDVEVLLYGYTLDASAQAAVGSLIDLVEGEMQGELGADRTIEADDYTETLDPTFTQNIWLQNTPVNSIASVVEDGVTLVEGTDFLLYANQGRLRRITSGGYAQIWQAYKPRSIVVTYNAGYSTVPRDLRKACAEATARLFRAGVSAGSALDAGSDGIKRVSLDGADEIEYFQTVISAMESGSVLTRSELATARAYRRKVVA